MFIALGLNIGCVKKRNVISKKHLRFFGVPSFMMVEMERPHLCLLSQKPPSEPDFCAESEHQVTLSRLAGVRSN